MTRLLGQRWYILGVRGAVSIVFGLVVLFWPAITVAALAALFGAYALSEGILTLGTALAGAERDDRRVVGFEGLFDVIAGGAVLVWPDITARALIFVLAAWAVATGVAEATAAIRVRRSVGREWLLAASGLGSLLTGAVLGSRPGAPVAAVAWLLGAFAVGLGGLLMALGARLRAHGADEDAEAGDSSQAEVTGASPEAVSSSPPPSPSASAPADRTLPEGSPGPSPAPSGRSSPGAATEV